MMRLDKLYLAAIVTVFFTWFISVPGAALAFHQECWNCTGGGQPVGPGTEQGSGPQNPEPKQEPKNGCDKSVSVKGDPVYTHSGEFFYECQDLYIPGRGMDVAINHIFRGGKAINNQFGYGWFINYYYRLTPLNSGNVLITSGEGRKDEFIYNATTGYTPPAGIFDTLVQSNDGTWTLAKTNGEKYNFDFRGVLTSIVDRNGNTITFTYSDALMPINGHSQFAISKTASVLTAMDYRLTRITDTLGRHIDLQYNASGRLALITDFTGRVVKFSYDADDNLILMTKPVTPEFPNGVKKKFTYDGNHNMTSIIDGRGQTFVTNKYDNQNRVITQTLGSGTYTFDYGVNTTTVTDRKGFVETISFNAAGNPLSSEKFTQNLRASDPPSFITIYTYDSFANVTSIKYPAGNGVKFTYDTGNPSR